MPDRCSQSCCCSSCITLEQASQSKLSSPSIDRACFQKLLKLPESRSDAVSYVFKAGYKEPQIRYLCLFDSTLLPQESSIPQSEIVNRSCGNEIPTGTRRLPNHRSQKQDKKRTEGRDDWTCLNRKGEEVPRR